MRSYLGLLVERIARDYLVENRHEIVKEIFPQQSENTCIQILRTNPKSNELIGFISGNKKNRVINGWNGDLVFLLNDSENGKRAVVFEIKFGHMYISKSQMEFFKSASIESADNFMHKLKELKIYIVHCHSLNLEESEVQMRTYEFISPRLKEYYRPSPMGMPKPERAEFKIMKDMNPDLAKIRGDSRVTKKMKRRRRNQKRRDDKEDKRLLRKQGRGSTRRKSMRELRHGGEFK